MIAKASSVAFVDALGTYGFRVDSSLAQHRVPTALGRAGELTAPDSSLKPALSKPALATTTLVFDPGRLSPVAVGGALIGLCAAVLFRHITAWVLTYAALISVPAAAFVGAVAITEPTNLAGRAGAGTPQSPPAERRALQPSSTTPPHGP